MSQEIKVESQEVDGLESPAGQSMLNFSASLVASTHKKLLKSLAHTQGGQFGIFPEDIRIIEGFNPRIPTPEFFAHIREVADSIKEHGFYPDKPIAGFAGMEGSKSVFFLTDGEVRYRAALMAIQEGAPLEVLPAVLKPEGTSMEDLTVALVRSNGGKRFTPLELAIVCARLSRFGWAPEKIGDSIGVTSEYVNQLLTLASAPKVLRDMVQNREAPAGVVIMAIKAHGSDAEHVLTQAVATAKASGKASITKRHLPIEIHKKAVRKAGPVMLDALRKVKDQSAFSTLPEELQATITKLLESLPEAPAEENEAAAQGGATEA